MWVALAVLIVALAVEVAFTVLVAFTMLVALVVVDSFCCRWIAFVVADSFCCSGSFCCSDSFYCMWIALAVSDCGLAVIFIPGKEEKRDVLVSDEYLNILPVDCRLRGLLFSCSAVLTRSACIIRAFLHV